jgi:MFS family permease
MTDKLHSAASDTFRSLKHRNFRLFFGGQLVSQTGTWLSMIAQILLIRKLTDSGFLLGSLGVFMFGPLLLLGPWAGAIADRADKRKLLTALQAAAMAQSFALGILVLSGHATIWAVYGLATVQGVITAFDNPVRRSFVVEMVTPEDLPNAVSLNSAIMTGSRVFGPAIAGALVLTVGYGWPFIIDGFSYLAVIGSLLMMRSDELFRSPPTPHRKGQVAEGLRYIRSEPNLLVPLIMMAIIGTFAFNFQVTVPLMVAGPLHGGTGTFTLLFSVLSLGSLIGALATARRATVTPHQLVQASAAFGVAMVLLALAPGLGIAFPVAVLLGLASIAFMTTSTAIVQLLAGAEYRGRVLAIQGMVFLGSTPIGGPIVGWVSDAVGPRAGIGLGAVACFTAAAYGMRALQFSDPRLQPAVEAAEPALVTDALEEAPSDIALVD